MKDLINFTQFYAVYNDDSYELISKEINDKSSTLEKIAAVKKIIESRKDQLIQLRDQVFKISQLIGSSLANDLLVSINSNISALDYSVQGLDGMTDENAMEAMQEFMRRVAESQEKVDELDTFIQKANDKYEENLLFSVRSGAVSIEEIESLKNTKGLSDAEIMMIDKAINQLREEKGLSVEEQEKQAEQTTVEDEKGNESETTVAPSQNTNSSTTSQTTIEEQVENQPLTLEQRLNNINYEQGKYGEKITEARLAYEIEQIELQVQPLIAKKQEQGKLSFKDAVLLQSLLTRAVELNELSFELSHKEQKREDVMVKTDDKMTETRNAIKEEKDKQAEYHSRLFKFISARREGKLEQRLDELRSKMIVIQEKQRTSSLLKFDKMNKKLVRKAQISAVKEVFKSNVQERITKLKALRDSVVAEAKNIYADAKRFVHRPEKVEELEGKPIILNGASNIIDLHQNVQEETHMLHAA